MPDKIARAFIHLLFIVLSLLCLIPIILVISASLTEETNIAIHGYTLWPSKFSSFAYEYLLHDPTQIVRAYGVTIFVTVVGTALSLLISSLLAYVLSRKDFKFRGAFSFYVFFTMLFNGGLVPTYLVMTKMLHLGNSVWALIVPYLVMPFFVLLLRTYFTEIPDSLIECAKIEGAGEIRIFRSVILPLSLPALATVGLFIILMYWNDWFLALLYVSGKSSLYPLQYLLYAVMENLNMIKAMPMAANVVMPGETARMAMAVLATGPIMFAFLFVQRFFVKGLTLGSIKG
ncbi:carbohydrate ABC transporter permease [Paenibacillus cymbidii]|uniref:carbohydrate ABC transporter permease n=1 Tax=Paenibacillus cymbidii TaxID=1639034 RepID=UPI001081E06C|nr:carbohydrate ABC transporter permease [Paenibacillus cymbidii]